MACSSCNNNYPTLRGRTFNLPIKEVSSDYSNCKPKQAQDVSKEISPACPIKELPRCDTCSTIIASALPECDVEELAQNPCTIVVASAFEEATCSTAGKFIRRSLRDLDGDQTFENLKPHLSDFNQVIDELNSSPIYKIQIPKTAIISSCGNCEYFLPPFLKEMISLTNDFPPQQDCFKVRRFINPPHEQFFGSNIPEHYTIFDNKIIIKDPKECGRQGQCAKLLKAHYWAKLPKASSLDDCLDIPDDMQVLINLNLTINIGVMLGLNLDKVTQCQNKLNEIKQFQKSFDRKKFSPVKYLNSGMRLPTSWLGQ